MWRPEFGKGSGLVRVGALSVELWRGSSRALHLVASEPCRRRASVFDPEPLCEALRTVLAANGSGRVSLVLESAFVPVLLADTGGVLSETARVESLLKYRFGLAYGSQRFDASNWDLRWDHRFGERKVLAFAMAAPVRDVLAESARSLQVTYTGWFPALTWSLDRFTPWSGWSGGRGWWAWPEQDRTLLAHLAGGRVDAMNPAAPLVETAADMDRVIRAEAVRCGSEAEPRAVGIGHWRRHDRQGGLGGSASAFGVEHREEVVLPPGPTRTPAFPS